MVDLLVCMATFGVKSARYTVLYWQFLTAFRRDTIFDPFPSVADPEDANKMILSPASKDYAKVEEILAKMPSIQVHSLISGTTHSTENDTSSRFRLNEG